MSGDPPERAARFGVRIPVAFTRPAPAAHPFELLYFPLNIVGLPERGRLLAFKDRLETDRDTQPDRPVALQDRHAESLRARDRQPFRPTIRNRRGTFTRQGFDRVFFWRLRPVGVFRSPDYV